MHFWFQMCVYNYNMYIMINILIVFLNNMYATWYLDIDLFLCLRYVSILHIDYIKWCHCNLPMFSIHRKLGVPYSTSWKKIRQHHADLHHGLRSRHRDLCLDQGRRGKTCQRPERQVSASLLLVSYMVSFCENSCFMGSSVRLRCWTKVLKFGTGRKLTPCKESQPSHVWFGMPTT